MNGESIKAIISESIATKQRALESDSLIQGLLDLAAQCAAAMRGGGKIMLCGNGGSFADAQHISAEFTSRFLFDRPGLASIALGTNSSSMSAIGNDYGYENIFSREIEAIGEDRDVLIALTTSGRSKNILKAIEAAHRKNTKTVVFKGVSDGLLPSGTSTICAPSDETPRIQEFHILAGHIVCELVEGMMFGNASGETYRQP